MQVYQSKSVFCSCFSHAMNRGFIFISSSANPNSIIEGEELLYFGEKLNS